MFSRTDSHSHSLDAGYIVSSMSFTSEHLILRSKSNPSSPFTLNAYNLNTGNFVNSKTTECKHNLPHSSLITVGAQDGLTNEILLAEGCPHSECKVIRSYDVTLNEAYIVCANVNPQVMSAGPSGSLLVADQKRNKLTQLEYKASNIYKGKKFQEIPAPFSVLPDCVQAMCYSHHNELLVLAHYAKQYILGLKITTGEVVQRIENPPDLGLNNRHLCSGSFGTIFIANDKYMRGFDESQRVVYETSYDHSITGIAAAFTNNNGECKLAIRYTTPDNHVMVDIRVPLMEKKLFVPIEPVDADVIDICSSDTDSDESSDVIIL